MIESSNNYYIYVNFYVIQVYIILANVVLSLIWFFRTFRACFTLKGPTSIYYFNTSILYSIVYSYTSQPILKMKFIDRNEVKFRHKQLFLTDFMCYNALKLTGKFETVWFLRYLIFDFFRFSELFEFRKFSIKKS
jgi:hypothetical protein